MIRNLLLHKKFLPPYISSCFLPRWEKGARERLKEIERERERTGGSPVFMSRGTSFIPTTRSLSLRSSPYPPTLSRTSHQEITSLHFAVARHGGRSRPRAPFPDDGMPRRVKTQFPRQRDDDGWWVRERHSSYRKRLVRAGWRVRWGVFSG